MSRIVKAISEGAAAWAQRLSKSQVFRHERQNMYVCWHPEVPFPYEMTKPIDNSLPLTDSNLKIQALMPVRSIFQFSKSLQKIPNLMPKKIRGYGLIFVSYWRCLQVKEAFRAKHKNLQVQELVKITYTTKHRFYGLRGKKTRIHYRDSDPNKVKRNRPYL